MPSLPCPWKKWYEEIINEAGYDMFSPDYYWFFRSSGEFTPQSNIDTLLDTKNHFEKNWKIQDIYSWKYEEIKYKNFVFIGESWGWWAVALLHKFDSSIKNIALINPVLEYKDTWKIGIEEESIEDFLWVFERWFKNLVRWLDNPEWEKHYRDEAWLTPTKNIENLKYCNVFLTHWDEDTIIDVSRARNFYEELKTLNPAGQFNYLEIPWGIHFWDKEKVAWLRSLPNLIKFFENKLK